MGINRPRRSMGLSRDKRHKRRATGGRRAIHIKKRKYEMARPPAMTKIGAKRVKVVRVRGGNYKYRAMRLEYGNFSWGSEAIAKKTKIIMYPTTHPTTSWFVPKHL